MHGASPEYFEFLEANSHILYPLVAGIVLALIAAGIVQALRAHEMDGLTKAEVKRQIIIELRQQMGGVTAEVLARALKLDPFRTVKLLEEMQRDGMVLSHTSTDRLTVWRLKGLPGYR